MYAQRAARKPFLHPYRRPAPYLHRVGLTGCGRLPLHRSIKKKLHARRVREHGERLLSPGDPNEPAGAAGESVVELQFMLVQVLTMLRLLLLAEDARETLVAALQMRRGGASAWAAAVGHGGAVVSRRRRAEDIFSIVFCVRASSWGRSRYRRVHSSGSFCASVRMYVRLSVGSVLWRVREV